MRYLHSTQDFGINIDVNFNPHVIAYVDASYAVHKDFKSHTGAVISLGQGPVYVKSTKQKINSKSSTEAEIVAVSDALSRSFGYVISWLSKDILLVRRNYCTKG